MLFYTVGEEGEGKIYQYSDGVRPFAFEVDGTDDERNIISERIVANSVGELLAKLDARPVINMDNVNLEELGFEIKKMTNFNHHGLVYEKLALELGYNDLYDQFVKINLENDRTGHIHPITYSKRYGFYQELIKRGTEHYGKDFTKHIYQNT